MLWFGFAIVVIMTLLLISIPLVRQYRTRNYDRLALNKSVYIDRKAELELELEQGTINDKEFQVLDLELQRTLLTDVAQETSQSLPASGQKLAYWISLVLVPVTSIALYLLVSDWREFVNWQNLLEKSAEFEQSDRTDLQWVQSLDNEEILLLLRTQLKYDSENPDRWLNYGQTLGQIRAFNEGTKAIEYALDLAPKDIALKLGATRTLMEFNTDDAIARARMIVDSILVTNPNHEAAMAVSGFIFKRQEMYQQAIDVWQSLLEQRALRGVEAGEGVALLKNQIKMAEDLIAQQQHLEQMAALLTVDISASEPALAAARPEARVFLIVRGNDGNPAPVAVKNIALSELPVRVKLTDADAMLEGRNISDMNQVTVQARMSQTGQASPSLGDWQSNSQTLTVGDTSEISVVIDMQVDSN